MTCYIMKNTSGQWSWNVVEIDETGNEQVIAGGSGYYSAEEAETGAAELFNELTYKRKGDTQ